MEWPTRSDGAPLTHVVQVDLATQAHNQGRREFALTGLPAGGVLHLFHDLTTFGWEATDDPTAWRVIWHALADAEDDLELVDGGPIEVVQPFPINAQLQATVPSPLDLGAVGDEEWARYERSAQWLEQSAYLMNMAGSSYQGEDTPWDSDYQPPPPVSRMGGFGFAESNPEVTAVLNEALPLPDGDSHVLLLDVNPGAISATDELIDWFHTRHLEVWMRRSDLDAQRFDDVWAVIRTDN